VFSLAHAIQKKLIIALFALAKSLIIKYCKFFFLLKAVKASVISAWAHFELQLAERVKAIYTNSLSFYSQLVIRAEINITKACEK
jgi:hypothetical protein